MSNNAKDQSEPAFPVIAGTYVREGMTKREVIAMHVMAELMGAVDSDGGWMSVGFEKEAAESARKSADALLAELGRE